MNFAKKDTSPLAVEIGSTPGAAHRQPEMQVNLKVDNYGETNPRSAGLRQSGFHSKIKTMSQLDREDLKKRRSKTGRAGKGRKGRLNTSFDIQVRNYNYKALPEQSEKEATR
jgi:hypothetical protein